MRKIKIILLFIIAFSCQTPFQKANEDYKRHLEKFPDKLKNHFPNKLSDSYGFIENFGGKYSPTAFIAKFTYNQSDFEKEVIKFNSVVKYEYNSSDIHLLVINPFNNSKNTLHLPSLNESEERQNLKSKYYVPVPNFIEINGKTENKCNLSADYEIKVFEYEEGNKWKNFHNDSHWNLPIGYEDGASSGIAINNTEKTIIYWLSIW